MEEGDWKEGTESKCWKYKDHVVSGEQGSGTQVEDSGEHPCGVCRKGVSKN